MINTNVPKLTEQQEREEHKKRFDETAVEYDDFDEDTSDDSGSQSEEAAAAYDQIPIAADFLQFCKPLHLEDIISSDLDFARAANAFIHEVGFDNVFTEKDLTYRQIRRTLDNVMLQLHQEKVKFHALLDMHNTTHSTSKPKDNTP